MAENKINFKMLNQINLNQNCSTVMKLSDLEKDKKYKIYLVEKVTTRYGESLRVMLKFREEFCKFYINKTYFTIFKDEVIQKINDGDLDLNLTYRGQCSQYSLKSLYEIKPDDEEAE